MSRYDLIVKGGTVATAADVMVADIAVAGGRIAALGADLGEAETMLDARGRIVTPGGVDSHCHIEQISASGLTNADTWETATRAAAFGGTTTVVPFVAQHRSMSLAEEAEKYHALAEKGAMVDYAFHLIITRPDDQTLARDLPALVASGHSSIKLFMTYEALRVDDEALLDVLVKARELGAFVMVHAENHGMIAWMVKRLVARGYTDVRYHAVSHPRGSEAEAFQRLIAMAELVDQPVMIYHVSTAEGAAVIRAARARGARVYGETCPQYLFLTAADLDRPGAEGAKWCCSPPPRTAADQEALWQALANGDLQAVSSDHSTYRFDATGKLHAGPNPAFKQVPNGIPGLEWRQPLMFDAMVSQGRMDLNAFVRLTATEPAKLYGLAPKKGSIAIGGDADLVIWDPERKVELTDALSCDATGYSPYAGRTVTGWPDTVIRRGEVIVAGGEVLAAPGSGVFLAREAGPAARPRGRPSPEFDPRTNFGAELG